MKKKTNLTLVLAVFLLAAAVFSRGFLPSKVPSPHPAQVIPSGQHAASIHFIDVGQGDASLIVSGGSAVLIDGGDTAAGDTVVDYLSHCGIAKLDAVVATHPHEDHYGGLIDVLETFDVTAVYLSDEAFTAPSYERLLDTIESRGISSVFPDIGDTISLGSSGAMLTVLAPGAHSRNRYGDDPNTWSLVLRLDAGGCSALFTGDTTASVEQSMVKSNPAMLDCDILKVAHHGSRTSSSRSFLEAVSPKYAVISYGAGNTYGLPNREFFDRIAPLHTTIYETARDGTVVLNLADGEVTKQ